MEEQEGGAIILSIVNQLQSTEGWKWDLTIAAGWDYIPIVFRRHLPMLQPGGANHVCTSVAQAPRLGSPLLLKMLVIHWMSVATVLWMLNQKWEFPKQGTKLPCDIWEVGAWELQIQRKVSIQTHHIEKSNGLCFQPSQNPFLADWK